MQGGERGSGPRAAGRSLLPQLQLVLGSRSVGTMFLRQEVEVVERVSAMLKERIKARIENNRYLEMEAEEELTCSLTQS